MYTDSSTKTLPAGGALDAFRRVKLSTGKLAYAGASDEDIGVTLTPAAAEDDPVTVKLRNGAGTFEIAAAGAFSAGAVYAAANGTVDDSGTLPWGEALAAASGAGSIVEVLPRISGAQGAAGAQGAQGPQGAAGG